MAEGRKGKGRQHRAGDTRRKRRRRRSRSYAIAGVLACAIVGVVALIVAGTVLRGGGGEVPAVTTPGEGALLGSSDAPVSITLYADFQCPACRLAAMEIVPKLEEEYITPGKARLEFRHYPFLGEESWSAAQAAECAKEQGKFWEYHRKLFNNQRGKNQGAFNHENLKEFAADLGLDTAAFDACLDSEKYADEVQLQYVRAKERGVESTPTFFVGDTKLSGVPAWGSFRTLIEQELKKGG